MMDKEYGYSPHLGLPSGSPWPYPHLSKESQPHLCLVLWPGQAEAARREEELTLVEILEG